MIVEKIVKISKEIRNYINDSILSVDCAEISMGNDSCRLIALNMFSCVINPFTDKAYFDFDKWYEISYEGQRLNDDLVDLELESIEKILNKINNDTEPDYIKDTEIRTWESLYEAGKKGRRTGLGFTALGDTIAALNLGYDSQESLNVINEICKVKCNAEFDSSIDMSIERGCFDGFDENIENKSEFIKMIKKELPEVYDRMMKFGRRNVSLSTVAPTGSLSILSQTTSGIEPLYTYSYKRRKKVLNDEPYDFIDDLGDKWKEFNVFHPKLKMFMDINLGKGIEDSPYYKKDANNIDWLKRIELQSIVQRYTTHSISSTINLPSDTTTDVINDIYFKGWELGLKGVTIYRDGSRSGVLVSSEQKVKSYYEDSNAPKRPKVLPCDIVRFTNKGEKWIGFIGLYKDDNNKYRPYELFTGLLDSFNVPSYVEKGEIIKNKEEGISRYDFVYIDKDGYNVIMQGLNRAFNREFWNLGKMMSAILRHRMPLKNVIELVDSLKFIDDSIVTWKQGIKRMIKKYIDDNIKIGDGLCPECNQDTLTYQDGCVVCSTCGYSKCS